MGVFKMKKSYERSTNMLRLIRSSAFYICLVITGIVQADSMKDANIAIDKQDYAAAIAILAPLARDGDVDALGTMGNIYGFGWGIEADLKVANAYWLKAADKHHAIAMYNLGTLYLVGKPGFPKDDEKAAQWMKLAAEHRHALAMFNLSGMYSMGHGIKQNVEEALAWTSLVLSNTNNPQVIAAANGQLPELFNQIPKERLPDVQARVNALAKTIDANVKAYRSNGVSK